MVGADIGKKLAGRARAKILHRAGLDRTEISFYLSDGAEPEKSGPCRPLAETPLVKFNLK